MSADHGRGNIASDHRKRKGGNPAMQLQSVNGSINPGGRVAGIHKLIDGIGIGKHCLEAFEFARDAMRGVMRDPQNPGAFVAVAPSIRLEACRFLIERRLGKVPTSIDVAHGGTVNHEHDHRHKWDLTKLTDTELEEMSRIMEIASPQIVEGEIVDEEEE